MTREEINEEKQKKISRENHLEIAKKIIVIVLKVAFILTIIISLFLSYTTYISNVVVGVREYRITSDSLPVNFDGIKIMQFSDLHYGGTMLLEHVKKIKKMMNDRKPDILVFTGDFIKKKYTLSEEETTELTKYLTEMSATLGKYAIVGDEDTEISTTILENAGFSILNNSYDLIYNEGTIPIMVVGISSLLNNDYNIDDAYQYFSLENSDPNLFTFTLIHEPDLAKDVVNYYNQTDLILAGHSHNGTIRIPYSQTPIERKKGAYTYPKEFYQIHNTKLYVSGGLGTDDSFPYRLFCRPSVSLYRLSRE